MSDETVSRSRTKTFILPTFLNCDYNSRAFKHIYRCENEPLVTLGWNSERLSSDEITEIFTKELEERAKGKKVKKQEAEAKRKNKEAAERVEGSGNLLLTMGQNNSFLNSKIDLVLLKRTKLLEDLVLIH